MVNVNVVKAFIEGWHYFDGRYLVTTRNTDYGYCKCDDRVIADHASIPEDDYMKFKTLLYLSICRDSNNEYIALLINKAYDVASGVAILNEVSDYIASITGVKMTAFTVEENVMYIRIEGHKYPYREYNNKTTLVKMRSKGRYVKIYGYYNRFALFRDSQCIEYAMRINELRDRIMKLYNELMGWYYKLDFEDLEKLHEVKRLDRNILVPSVGMYIGRRSPRQVLRAYERMAEMLEEMVTRARELYTLRNLTS
jgi:hypothetical protein